MPAPIPRLSTAGAAILALCTSLGCVSDRTSQKPPPPPSDLQPRLVTLALHNLLDEDRNGYPDTLPVAFYLWDDRYPLPMWHEGEIRFTLEDESGVVFAEWDVPEQVVVAARRRDQVGAVHVLTLDIRQATTDVLPPTVATLGAEFLATDGQRASTMRPLVVRLGS